MKSVLRVNWARCAILIACLELPVRSGRAQPAVVATGIISQTPPPCRDCIRMTQLVTLGDSAGAGFIEGSQDLVRDTAGRYWVGQNGHLKVFDRDGRFLASVGRQGDGPLEFAWPRPQFVDERGRVHVFDRNNRATVIAPDFSYVTAYQTPSFVWSLVRTGIDGYIANMWLSSNAAIGQPLHVVKGERTIKSFGLLSSDQGMPISDFLSRRILARSPNARLFSAKLFSYEIGVWDNLGERPFVALLGPRLNDRIPTPTRFTKENGPANQIMTLRAPDDGHVWVGIQRVRDDWLSHMEERPGRGGQIGLALKPGSTLNSIYGGRIDVLDIESRKVVARADVDETIVRFLDDSHVVTTRFLEDGTPQLVVWKLSMTLQPRR